MKHHSELLNLIAKKINARTYVEIGVFNPDHNFHKVEIKHKLGIDPDPNAGANCRMSSDEFFSIAKLMDAKVDLFWIDGLHHDDQVQRDILNAWQLLNPRGVIAIHDCNPHSESITHVPRDNREWTGNVYRAICRLLYPMTYFTIDFDYGCCIIRKEQPGAFIRFTDIDVSWEKFNDHRESMINLVSLEQGLARIEQWT
jgi:hypothetical protein